MTTPRTWITVLAAAAVAGCATGHTVDRARDVSASGDTFTGALATDYSKLAVYEADEMGDWRDANFYANRSLRAADGKRFPPIEPGSRDVPENTLPELRKARSKMMSLFGRGAREQHPEIAARAQSQYDCWVEQREENHQPDHIARCREGFRAALKKLRGSMMQDETAAESGDGTMEKDSDAGDKEMAEKKEKSEKDKKMMKPKTYTVYFGLDSAKVTANQVAPLHDAAAFARKHANMTVSVVGHTDTSGDSPYNRKLSMKRARNVKDVLTGFGVAGERISVAAEGETEPAVKTGEGVRERDNRRVVVTVK